MIEAITDFMNQIKTDVLKLEIYSERHSFHSATFFFRFYYDPPEGKRVNVQRAVPDSLMTELFDLEDHVDVIMIVAMSLDPKYKGKKFPPTRSEAKMQLTRRGEDYFGWMLHDVVAEMGKGLFFKGKTE